MICETIGYVVPNTVAEAVDLLGRPGARPLAGGQQLLVDLRAGRLADGPSTTLVDLRHVTSMRATETLPDGGLRLGGLVTLDELTAKPTPWQALTEAATEIGDPQVRNRATVGGNVALAGRGTDLAAVLLALDARLVLDGAETVALHQFLDAPADRLITAVELPAPEAGVASAYEKIAHRASRFPVSGVAVAVRRSGDGAIAAVRVAVTGATATPTRLSTVEEALLGTTGSKTETQAAFAAVPESAFRTTRDNSPRYLKSLTAVLTARALARAAT